MSAKDKKEWKEGDKPLNQEQVLGLQVLFLKHENIKSKLQALEQRRTALLLEANIVETNMPQVKKQQDDAAAAFTQQLTKIRQEYGIPEDFDLNAESGALQKRVAQTQ